MVLEVCCRKGAFVEVGYFGEVWGRSSWLVFLWREGCVWGWIMGWSSGSISGIQHSEMLKIGWFGRIWKTWNF